MVFLQQLLAVHTRQTRQVVHAINQFIFNKMSMVLTNFWSNWIIKHIQHTYVCGGEGAHTHTHHRFLRKIDSSSFVICLVLAFALTMVFLWQPLTVLTRQATQVVCSLIILSFLDVYGLTYLCSSWIRKHLHPHTQMHHWYLRKIDSSSFVMWPQLALILPRVFL